MKKRLASFTFDRCPCQRSNLLRFRSICFLWFGFAAVLAWSAGCTSNPFGDSYSANANVARRRAVDGVSYWNGDGVSGQPSIQIHLGEQRAYFYKGDQLVGVSLLSTGREGHQTPAGRFSVIEKDKDHRSSEYGDYVEAATHRVAKSNVKNGEDPKPPGTTFLGAPMPNFLRITGGVGLHAGYLPGVPASHGCIRMPAFMAKNFFDNAPLGTPVSVVQ